MSYNPMDQITSQQFSQYCSLTSVALESTTEMSPCMCRILRAYFDRRRIQLRDWFDCPTIHEGKFWQYQESYSLTNNSILNSIFTESVYCTGSMNATESPEYDKCMTLVEEKQRHEKSKKTWFWIMCCLGGFFVTFICKF